MTDRNLLERAAAAMANSYSPYSRFPVGAAIECADGSVFTGCNIENCALGSTICAERVAVGNAVSQGHTDFVRIAIISKGTNYCVPCGQCRQVIVDVERRQKNPIRVIMTGAGSATVVDSAEKLLPFTFKL